jgi:hypothetical protein
MRKAIWIVAVGTLLVTGSALADDAAAPAAAAAPPVKKSHGAKYGAA